MQPVAFPWQRTLRQPQGQQWSEWQQRWKEQELFRRSLKGSWENSSKKRGGKPHSTGIPMRSPRYSQVVTKQDPAYLLRLNKFRACKSTSLSSLQACTTLLDHTNHADSHAHYTQSRSACAKPSACPSSVCVTACCGKPCLADLWVLPKATKASTTLASRDFSVHGSLPQTQLLREPLV